MKTALCVFVLLLHILCGNYLYAAFWGNLNTGYASDDNFYKDVFGYKNDGYYSTIGLNLKNKISPVFNYEANYLFSLKKHNDIYWENNTLNDFRLSLGIKPAQTFTINILPSVENQVYQDEFSVKYDYVQNKIGSEIPVYFFDYTTPKIGYFYESIVYNNFSYDSTAAGPLLEIQQELSAWTKIIFDINYLDRKFLKQYIYENVVSTTTNNRIDKETYSNITVSSVLDKNLNASFGIKYAGIRSNANFVVFDPSAAISSKTLVSDYYSYTDSAGFAEITFYSFQNLSCVFNCSYSVRSYAERFASNSAGQMLLEKRNDIKKSFYLELAYKFFKDFAIKANYLYENSSSNDYVYNYVNNVISSGFILYF